MSSVYRDNANAAPQRAHFTPEVRLPLTDGKAEPWSFKTRDQFPDLMNQWGLTNVGVEVGVYRGGFSAYLLKHWEGVLHLVDPWVYQPDKRDLLNTPDLPSNYLITLRALDSHIASGRAVIHKGYSVEIAKAWDDGSLDWVYIDALHDFDSCLADMRAWAPLIRPGGALCGHDYLDHPTGPDTQTEFGVVSAVRTWCNENGYSVENDVITTTHDGFPTWVVRLRDEPVPDRAPTANRLAQASSPSAPTDTSPSPPTSDPTATPG